jgi:hypothetical protein
MSNQDWELIEVSNAGDADGSQYPDAISVPTKTMQIDMKAQLLFIPKKYSITVGWKAYVWQKKESGAFKDLNEEEYQRLLESGTVAYARETDGDSGIITATSGNQGSTETGTP